MYAVDFVVIALVGQSHGLESEGKHIMLEELQPTGLSIGTIKFKSFCLNLDDYRGTQKIFHQKPPVSILHNHKPKPVITRLLFLDPQLVGQDKTNSVDN